MKKKRETKGIKIFMVYY